MPTSFLTPGVRVLPAERVRPVGPLVRSDVTALLGYTRRGPAFRPVRVESWREFEAHFGEPYEVGHLASAVRAFFDNGGTTARVARVVDPTASAAFLETAPVDVAGDAWRWRFQASFNPAFVDEPEGTLPEEGATPAARRLPDPGAWGNQLRVQLSRDASLRTSTVPGAGEEGGRVTGVEGLGGIEADTVVELRQDGVPDAVLAVRSVDWARGTIAWPRSLAELGFDLAVPVRLESVEVSLRVVLAGRVVEEFRRLGVHPDHSRALLAVVPRESRWIDAALVGPPGADARGLPWTLPELWPLGVDAALGGGSDGLTGVAAADWERALGEVGRVEEVGLLAAPDLVLRAAPPAARPPAPPARLACDSLEPRPTAVVFGRVVTRLDPEGAPQPVRGVEVVEVASGVRARSDAAGEFLLEGVGPDAVILRLEKPGLETLELPAQAEPSRPAVPVDFSMTPLLLPRALAEEEVLRVQQAMLAQEDPRLYRFALLDPPAPDMDVAAIRSWRARLGDSSYGALYHPWLLVRSSARAAGAPQRASEAGLVALPPSGHVAGVTAAVDRREGVHRSPANRPLSLVEDVTVAVDDAAQGILNPAGVNCIRVFPGRGVRVYGGRTLSGDPEWRYANVRRLVLVIEETLEKAFQWAVFEPNDAFRRQALSMSIGALLERLRRSGALAGEEPAAAWRVKCDEDNNPPSERDAGRLLVEIAVAPAVPFEFVVFRLGVTADAVEVTE